MYNVYCTCIGHLIFSKKLRSLRIQALVIIVGRKYRTSTCLIVQVLEMFIGKDRHEPNT